MVNKAFEGENFSLAKESRESGLISSIKKIASRVALAAVAACTPMQENSDKMPDQSDTAAQVDKVLETSKVNLVYVMLDDKVYRINGTAEEDTVLRVELLDEDGKLVVDHDDVPFLQRDFLVSAGAFNLDGDIVGAEPGDKLLVGEAEGKGQKNIFVVPPKSTPESNPDFDFYPPQN